MTRRPLLASLALALSMTALPASASAQEKPRADHEGEIDCAIPRHALAASNSSSLMLTDLLVSSYALLGGSSSKRCTYRPTGLTLTLPAGIPPKEWSFGASNPTIVSNGGDAATHERRALVTLKRGTVSCIARASISLSGPTKLVMNLGDISALFDESGKPVAAKCGAK
jgi:hypothetical protein